MPGQLAHHAREQRAAKISTPAPLVGRADEDVRRAALVRDAAHGLDEVVALLLEEVDRRACAASRRSAASCVASSSVGSRPGRRTQSASISAPSRCAERQARRMIRCDFGCGSTSASTRSATACWLSGSSTAGCRRASTSSATSRSASSRSAPRLSSRKKFCSATSARSARVDLAGAQPLLQRLGREVDEHDLVGLVEDPVRERLADAHAGELEDRVVQALEVLDVDGRDDVDAGVEDVLDVLVALLVAHPGRVRVRELVDQRQLGRARDHGVDVHLLELEPAVRGSQARHRLEPLGERRRLRPVVRLEVADHDVTPLGLRLPALLQHPVGLADSRRPSRAGSGSGRAPSPPQAPNTLWTSRSISLIPMKGRITPPSP